MRATDRKSFRMFTAVLLIMMLVATSVGTALAAESAPTLSKKELDLKVSKTYTLKVKNADSKVTWSSSDKAVVTVSSKGKVTAKDAGTATVTAKVDGKKLKCKVTVTNDFADGRGTKKDPFQVKTFSQLKKIKNYRTKHFVQIADIDAKGKTLKTMFSKSKPFTGTYDGQGYTISNFVLTKANYRVGIFGEADVDSVLKDIHLDNVTAKVKTSSTLFAGALAGQTYGTIQDCSVEDINIKITDETLADADTKYIYNAAGGVVGRVSGGLITGCSAEDVTISKTRDVGGLAGAVAKDGNVEFSYVENISAKASGGAGATVGSINEGGAHACETAGDLDLSGKYRYDNNFGYTKDVNWY